MTAPLSQDLRKRLVVDIEGGGSCRQAAARFAVSASAAIKLMQRVRRTGSTTPGRIGGYRKAKLADHEDYLRELTRTRVGITLKDTRVGITLEEMKAALFEERGVAVSITAISRRLHRIGLSHKKSR